MGVEGALQRLCRPDPGPGSTPEVLDLACVLAEGMTGEVKAERFLLVVQANVFGPFLDRLRPGLNSRRMGFLRRAEEVHLRVVAFCLSSLGTFQRPVEHLHQGCPMIAQTVERASLYQALEHAAIDGAKIHPLAEVRKGFERAVVAAGL